MTDDGLVTIRSAHSVSVTIDRLQAVVVAREMTVFARIDHAQGAADAGLSLRPTELLVFGNAWAGTPLMQAHQSVGIDLPLKVLVWQNADGVVWLTYNEPSWIARRHELGPALDQAVSRMAAMLTEVAEKAAAADE